MKLGYHLAPWIRDGHLETFHRALDEIALSGWDGLELLGSWAVEMWGHTVADLRALLRLHDLELASCYVSLSYLPERRDQESELARRAIALAAEAGGATLLLDGGPQRPAGTGEDDYKRVADLANAIGAWAAAAGLQCCWHQHWGSMFEWAAPFGLCWPFGSSVHVMSVRGSPACRPALR